MSGLTDTYSVMDASGRDLLRMTLRPLHNEIRLLRIILDACEQNSRSLGDEELLTTFNRLVAELDPHATSVGLSSLVEILDLLVQHVGDQEVRLDTVDIHSPGHTPDSTQEATA